MTDWEHRRRLPLSRPTAADLDPDYTPPSPRDYPDPFPDGDDTTWWAGHPGRTHHGRWRYGAPVVLAYAATLTGLAAAIWKWLR